MSAKADKKEGSLLLSTIVDILGERCKAGQPELGRLGGRHMGVSNRHTVTLVEAQGFAKDQTATRTATKLTQP